MFEATYELIYITDLLNVTGELGISVMFSEQIFTLHATIAKFYWIGLY